MWTFNLTQNDLTIWYSTSTKHHLLATTVSNRNATSLKKPKKYPLGTQLDFPDELFETVEMNTNTADYKEYLFYKEALVRNRQQPEALLQRLRPLLPIPYWITLGLLPPIFAVDSFPAVNGEAFPCHRFVSNQTFKVADFLADNLKTLLTQNNVGPVGLHLNQLDAWKMSLRDLRTIERQRPVIISLDGNPSSLYSKKIILNNNDCLSMAAQVSLMFYVARKTIETFRYGDLRQLRGLYQYLYLEGSCVSIGITNEIGIANGIGIELQDPFDLQHQLNLLRLSHR